MKKISVIIPVWNTEKYVDECIDSILAQSIVKDLEIICVNDGSTDNTLKIAREYVEKFPKIFELFTFENAGLGAARNRGTRLASAKYIAYLDPDDKLTAGIYKKAVDLLDETNSEILIGGTKRFNSKKVWNSTIHSRSVNTDLVKTNINEHPERFFIILRAFRRRDHPAGGTVQQPYFKMRLKRFHKLAQCGDGHV